MAHLAAPLIAFGQGTARHDRDYLNHLLVKDNHALGLVQDIV